jgi:hypothetical protein
VQIRSIELVLIEPYAFRGREARSQDCMLIMHR